MTSSGIAGTIASSTNSLDLRVATVGLSAAILSFSVLKASLSACGRLRANRRSNSARTSVSFAERRFVHSACACLSARAGLAPGGKDIFGDDEGAKVPAEILLGSGESPPRRAPRHVPSRCPPSSARQSRSWSCRRSGSACRDFIAASIAAATASGILPVDPCAHSNAQPETASPGRWNRRASTGHRSRRRCRRRERSAC